MAKETQVDTTRSVRLYVTNLDVKHISSVHVVLLQIYVSYRSFRHKGAYHLSGLAAYLPKLSSCLNALFPSCFLQNIVLDGTWK